MLGRNGLALGNGGPVGTHVGADGAPERRPELAGSVCLLTGASSGIGEATASLLAAGGMRMLLVGRSLERGTKTIARIRSAVPGSDLQFFLCDLTRLVEVRRLAVEVRDATDRLDVLLNNAGAIFFAPSITAEGNEATLALNVLAPFLLTELLLDRLEAGRGRVVNVSSAAHRTAFLRRDDLDRSRAYSAWGAYSQSKLALLMLTYEAARRHAGDGVSFNACHPGFIRSRFGDAGGATNAYLLRIAKTLFARSVASGAKTPTYLASAPELEGVSGKYFVRNRPRRSSRTSYDREAARWLWETCLERTSADRPGPPDPGRA